MGDEVRAKRARRKRHVEVLDLGDRHAESKAILHHFAGRADELVGLMVIAELPGGGFEVKYTGTMNVAERLGRLDILHDLMLDEAQEDGG